jgi:hypothetical protein
LVFDPIGATKHSLTYIVLFRIRVVLLFPSSMKKIQVDPIVKCEKNILKTTELINDCLKLNCT